MKGEIQERRKEGREEVNEKGQNTFKNWRWKERMK